MIRYCVFTLLLAMGLGASLGCGARPKSAPNDEVTTPLTIEDERALEEEDAPPPKEDAVSSP